MLARQSNWKPGGEVAAIAGAPGAQAARATRWFWLRTAWITAVVVALLATFAGYARLASFILVNLFYSLIIIAVLLLCHVTMRELLHALARRSGDEPRGELFGWWTLRFFDLGLGALAVLGILPIWGVDWDEIGDFAWRALFGLKVGGYTVSLINLFAAIVAFVGIRFLTRIVQRAFERTILPQTRLDPGVGNSIRAGIGYIGLALAAFAALGALGLDLTNIALVAGALSVGIGFGLQNVVNNFVSGIILLVERPIKVGDWVVVGANEGTIRRINVRATEIETFRRSTVIIPNAELLSSSVINWTYKDRLGRVEVRIGVAWDADTELVEKILLDCAREDPRVLSDPAPHALLNFGASALEFELRAVLADASTMAFVASDLRKKILVRLGEAGIAIPLPVTDSRVRRPETPPA
jgi:small-conductance mechanosensitive channel